MKNEKLLRWLTGLCQLVTVLAVILLVAGQARALQPVAPPTTLPATGGSQTAPIPESTPAPQSPSSGVTPPAPPAPQGPDTGSMPAQSPNSGVTPPAPPASKEKLGFFEKRSLQKEVTERYNALAQIEWLTDEQQAALNEIAAALGR